MKLSPAVRSLRDYIAIPSVNPGDRTDLPAEQTGESRYAEHVREQLRRMGVDAELLGREGRQSVVAEVRVPKARQTILIASHLDTVPVDGMEIDPFDPVVKGNRLYGRGSCDTKGGMAALLAALSKVLPGGTLRSNVVVVGESDEEAHSSQGARDVLARLGGQPPDWVLATEPTELRLITKHKGIGAAKLRARGCSVHSSDPKRGRNAITSLCRAALAIEQLSDRLAERSDPDLGTPSLNVGIIGGGQAVNIVPDDAWLMTDRRVLPGETPQSMRRELEEALRRNDIDDVTVEEFVLGKPALATPSDHSAVARCQQSLAACGLAIEPGAVAFATDAGVFAEAGWPGVVMGPGSIAQAHTSREFVEVDQVDTMTDFFISLLTS